MKNYQLAVIGLGYVGLPLAVAFGKKIPTVGFDINNQRIEQLSKGIDKTFEVNKQEIKDSNLLSFTADKKDIQSASIYIITVPTPIDDHKRPDLRPLINATKLIGKILNKGNIVIYESTVYPGATEEVCVPVLESESGLQFNKDFFVGYSPERINPGDKEHRISDIVKVTSGSLPDIAEKVDNLYKLIITAGTFRVSSIKVAEAAKVIENTQRDVNIALMNELSKIFNILEIETEEVLRAAESKWNFLKFSPGLVGGHCIGIDPYYLTHKAQEIGYKPEVILSGRRINDTMGEYVANRLVNTMIKKGLFTKQPRVLVLGLTFKENCPDIRNTKVLDVVSELSSYGCDVDIFDPWVDKNQVIQMKEIRVLDDVECGVYDAIIIAVAHKKFYEMGVKKIKSFGVKGHVLFDFKSIFPSEQSDLRA
tara:strand:+ start:3055 stop:4323 length:1269 start_codon:yes stop_codon:yes gene_type:complete